jgi:CDGSH-type Zn-finger protein
MIKTLDDLHKHLQWALELEHSTIPPYLCALYSVKSSENKEAIEVIHSIFIEEMLHMALVANIAIATGCSLSLDSPDFLPNYPCPLPHSDKSFLVSIESFSKEAIQTFMKIERPADATATAMEEGFSSIGQFYKSIENALIYLASDLGEDVLFSGNPNHQISEATSYYGGSGALVAVNDLQSALAALSEVVEQGEGLSHSDVFDGDQNMFHPEKAEVAHYFRFMEILEGKKFTQGDTPQSGPTGESFIVNWDNTHRMVKNPKVEDFKNKNEIYEKLVNFNQQYSDMLRLLERSFNGEPQILNQAVGLMYELKILAQNLLLENKIESGLTVGPTFEYETAREYKQQQITIRKNGPYVVSGGLQLADIKRIGTDNGEPIAWKRVGAHQTDETFELCRCGKSSTKPFCDGTHERVEFDGTETAATNSISERQETIEGDGIKVKVDRSFCMHSKFCFNKMSGIRKLLPESTETTSKSSIIAMVDRCPSGSFSYELSIDNEFQPMEAIVPEAISVIGQDKIQNSAGPLWVTGDVKIVGSDGKQVETRNRVTLCRCGASKNKPFCDGSHIKIEFKD